MRKQYLFCILILTNLLLFTSSLYCQDKTEYLIQNLLKLYHTPFAKSSIVWDDSSNNKNDTLKNLALMQFLLDTNENYTGYGKWRQDITIDSFAREYSSSFHLIDLNADNKPELIFNGKMIGDMGTYLFIYYFDGKRFLKVNQFFGEIVQLIKRSDNFIDLIICNYPCCAAFDNDLSYLEITDFGYIINATITFERGAWFYFCETSLPAKINPPKEITLNKGVELDFWYLSDTIPNCDPINEKKTITLGITKRKIKTVYYGTYENGIKNKWYFVKITRDMSKKIDRKYKLYSPIYLVWIQQ